MAKGIKTGGRSAGTKNKVKFDVAEIARKENCNPFQIQARIANGKLPCTVCFGTGKTRYEIPGTGKSAVRDCQSCWGTLKEKISPGDRLKAACELARYIAPQLKAIEHTGSDGKPLIPTAVRVTLVRATPIPGDDD